MSAGIDGSTLILGIVETGAGGGVEIDFFELKINKNYIFNICKSTKCQSYQIYTQIGPIFFQKTFWVHSATYWLYGEINRSLCLPTLK